MEFDSDSAKNFLRTASNECGPRCLWRGSKFIVALGLVLFGASAQADTRTVYFVGNGFFPSVVYAAVGDTIEIINFHTSSAEVTIDGTVVPYDPTCNNAEWLDDNNLDCDSGAGNNDPALDINVNGETFETNLSPSAQVRFSVVYSGPTTLSGQRSEGGGYVNADHDGVVSIGETPDLGGA